ncbi:Acetyltransferase (isoleucine patch superfamily protein) [Oceanicola granulosus HTCC2516]|uniref:Acetyltransferase (Isoleucine patch superfamily protein) n=2 Tax=Oceanicola granulosus TaxID=252302 RepID=Q2CBT8_OCEGH|nr:Acetyltransferase (isoleucine patch superfamily protein) [Oceanicola granulosus HTCC2516]
MADMTPRILTFSNAAYVPVTRNWLAHLATLGLAEQATVVTLDSGARTAFPVEQVLHRPAPEPGLAGLWKHRMAVCQEILEAGEALIHSDADAIWLDDPRPRIAACGSEMVFSQGTVWPYDIHERLRLVLCCGFFYLAPTSRVRTLMDQVLQRLDTDGGEDQEAVNRVVAETIGGWDVEEPYEIAFRDTTFRASRRPIHARPDPSLVAVLPHHAFPRRLEEVTREVVVAHPFSEKTGAGTRARLAALGLWRSEADAPAPPTNLTRDRVETAVAAAGASMGDFLEDPSAPPLPERPVRDVEKALGKKLVTGGRFGATFTLALGAGAREALETGRARLQIGSMRPQAEIDGVRIAIDDFSGHVQILIGSAGTVMLGRLGQVRLDVRLGHQGVLLIGDGTTVNQARIIAVNSAILVGRDGLWSDEILVQGFDQHGIVDLATREIINRDRKNVLVGRHAWIGRRATLMPATRIGQGAIIGTGAVVTRDVPPCTAAAGSPARVLREGVSWSRSWLEFDAASTAFFDEVAPLDDSASPAAPHRWPFPRPSG